MCTLPSRSAAALACLRLAGVSSVKLRLLRTRPSCVLTRVLLPVYEPVLHLSVRVRRGAVPDARLGLACCPVLCYLSRLMQANVDTCKHDHGAPHLPWSDISRKKKRHTNQQIEHHARPRQASATAPRRTGVDM